MRRLLVLLLAAAAARADVVVDRDGNLLRGTAEVRRDEGAVSVGAKTLPLEQVYLVEDDAGRLLYAPDFEARVRGYEYVANELVRDDYVRVVRAALQVEDVVLASLALERAERAGLANREAASLKTRIDRAAGGDDEVKSERVHEMLRRVDARYGEFLAERAATALDGGDADGARLLREALRRAPDSETARARLASMAPEAFALGDARAWLDWRLDLEAAGGPHVEGGEGLTWARAAWRKDVHGIGAGPILLVTPLRESRRVGRCLAFGRLGVRVLEELFATGGAAPDGSAPMLVLLFPDREDYLKTSAGSAEERSFLEWTAGHYNPREKVSRFYWDDDPDAERRLVGTLVHELSHQWLAERNPRGPPSDRIVPQPGYWIVEGFATFMEEGIYDAATGQWDLFNPRSRSLDVLQAAKPNQLIPWDSFYGLSQASFVMLPPDRPTQVNLRWSMRPTIVSARRMFYEQGGATCQFLYHAEGGRHRAKLLAFVGDYYAGKSEAMDPERAFGMDAKELGAKVAAFARSVAGGWRPG